MIVAVHSLGGSVSVFFWKTFETVADLPSVNDWPMLNTATGAISRAVLSSFADDRVDLLSVGFATAISIAVVGLHDRQCRRSSTPAVTIFVGSAGSVSTFRARRGRASRPCCPAVSKQRAWPA